MRRWRFEHVIRVPERPDVPVACRCGFEVGPQKTWKKWDQVVRRHMPKVAVGIEGRTRDPVTGRLVRQQPPVMAES